MRALQFVTFDVSFNILKSLHNLSLLRFGPFKKDFGYDVASEIARASNAGVLLCIPCSHAGICIAISIG
jgi:hypothetical protein